MDDNYGDNRGRNRPDRDRDSRFTERGHSSQNRNFDRGPSSDDRGFLDRAGDEVRSWFGDDDAEARRERDEHRWERERGMSGQRDDQDRNNTYAGPGATAGGWGNQSGESWNRDRPGTHGSYGAYGASGRERSNAGRGYAAQQQGGGRNQRDGNGSQYDPRYSEWRNRQIESLDKDYAEYRREHQSKFEQDFGNWRSKRGEQRQSMNKVAEQMEVVGSDGEHIGKVDKVRGDRIILAKNDENSGGIHHSIPCSWIEAVDDKVIVNKSRDQAMREWRDEERNRALFEREDSGSDGPHMLNRSFSGTY